MTNHELYKNAMAKVTPSEAWKQDTLTKLAAARAEAGAAPAPQPTPQKKAKPRLSVWRRAALPMAGAAAFALVAVPLAAHSGLLAGGSGAAAPQNVLMSGAAAPAAQSADAGEENVPAQDSAGSEPLAGAAPRAGTTKTGGTIYFDQGSVNGLPVLVWNNDFGGMGGGLTTLARSTAELYTANPTFNLPGQELPSELPVWYAQSGAKGSKALEALLQRAAEFLKLPLRAEEVDPVADGYPTPQLWPCILWGRLVDPAVWQDNLPIRKQDPNATLWRLDANGTQLTLTDRTVEDTSNEAQYSDPAAALAGNDAALKRFGALAGLETPAYQSPTPTYTQTGETVYEWFSNFYYEAGEETDAIGQKLFNYSFKRVYGSLNGSGELKMARLTLPPETETVGVYPLRSLEAARAALQKKLDQEVSEGWRSYPLSTDDIVTWQLDYSQSTMNPYIQPIYTFVLKTPLTPAEAGYALENAAGYDCYVSYSISALPEEYCIDWQEQFN